MDVTQYDQNGNDISGMECNNPVETFLQLLAAAYAPHASNLMNNMIQDDFICSVVKDTTYVLKTFNW